MHMELAEFFIRFSLITGFSWQHLSKNDLFPGPMMKTDLLCHLKKIAMGVKQIQQFFNISAEKINQSLDWLNQPSSHLIHYWHPSYPPLLKVIQDPPVVLFVMGNAKLLVKPQIAIIGSRKCSAYGVYFAKQFTRKLASSFVITSGLALGIDTYCHQAALSIEGSTIAVLGSGHLHIGPFSNRPLARQIIEQKGAIISEFIPPFTAKPYRFPRRNRLISGLSMATLIVEASLNSGSLTTAYHALNQGRDIFVLPGSATRQNNKGNIRLIEEGATVVTSAAQIISALSTSSLYCFVQE